MDRSKVLSDFYSTRKVLRNIIFSSIEIVANILAVISEKFSWKKVLIIDTGGCYMSFEQSNT